MHGELDLKSNPYIKIVVQNPLGGPPVLIHIRLTLNYLQFFGLKRYK